MPSKSQLTVAVAMLAVLAAVLPVAVLSISGGNDGTTATGEVEANTNRSQGAIAAPDTPGAGTTNQVNIKFDDQATNGRTVTIRSVTLPDGGRVFIQVDRGGAPGGLIGQSSALPPGTSKNVRITLNKPINSTQTLWAIAESDDEDHLDSARVNVTTGSPVDVDGNGETSKDGVPTGDGLHQDIQGDGDTDIFDVLAFFRDVAGAGTQDTAGNSLYDFDGDRDVDIFDVQSLFDTVAG